MTRPPRGRGRCRRCGRVVLLTRNGKLFLHGEAPAVWENGAYSCSAHCLGGMTVEFDPPDAAVVPLQIREARP